MTKEKIRIAFFDIDGTLMPFHHKRPHPVILETLEKLQSQGILCFAASGRPPYIIPDLGFDGCLAFNGGLCELCDGTILFERPMDPVQVKELTLDCEQKGYGVIIAGTQDMGANFYDQNMDDYIKSASQRCIPDPEFEKRFDKPCFQLMAAIPTQDRDPMLAGYDKLDHTSWHPLACDITAAGTSKGEALRAVCEKLGIPVSESIAFGDAANDLSMIEAAGIGIAMGNAQDVVKEKATRITESVDEDGVYTEFRRMGYVD